MIFNIGSILQNPMDFLIGLFIALPGICLAISIHESAHGWVAEKCGDPTARYAGRITLNPIKHFDPIGFLCMFFVGVGWAKPVPVNPLLFKHYRRDDLKVALAGITANLCLFLLCLLVLSLIFSAGTARLPEYEADFHWIRENAQYKGVLFLESDEMIEGPFILRNSDGSKELAMPYEGTEWSYYPLSSIHGYEESKLIALETDNAYFYDLESVFDYFYTLLPDIYTSLFGRVLAILFRVIASCMLINLSLAVFNLIPIPPFDGYHVINDLFLKQDLFAQRRTTQICSMAFLALIMIGNIKPEWDIISIALSWIRNGVMSGAVEITKLIGSVMGAL